HRGLLPDSQVGSLSDGYVGARDHPRNIHDCDQRRAGRGHLTRVQRTISYNSTDWAADLRIRELRLGALILSASRLDLRLRALHLFVPAYALKRLQVFLGSLILAPGLRVTDGCFIHQPARQSAFLKQLLAALQQ